MRLTHLALPLTLLACSAGTTDDGSQSAGAGSGGNGSGTGSSTSAQSTGDFGVGGGGTSTPTGIGTMSGKVTAPNGTTPISGALVYLTKAVPDAIPDGVYCDRCVELDQNIAKGFSNADGTFQIPIYAEGPHYLVVQKGQFRRYRQVTLVKGAMQADPASTQFPSRMDKANGDDIPKMAIQEGNFDEILTTLTQLGIAEDQIDVFGCSGFSCSSPFDDYATLSQYHIAFVPCSSCTGAGSGQSDNIRQFVNAGGKFYVTDWSYQWMDFTFPGFVEFDLISDGDACSIESYTATATDIDPDLQAWLAAQTVTDPTFEAAYTRITGVNSQPGTDIDGQPTTIDPKVWVRGNTPSGNNAPLTVSFEQQCGRVLFSTYHSESSGQLLPQELALLYVLLEVGVCVGEAVPE